jgi:hypothetical protein
MAIITIIAAWCAFQANRGRLERQVEREVLAIGGRIESSQTDWSNHQPVAPSWYEASYERAMVALFSRRYIRSVDVSNRDVTKECLDHVFQLPHLQCFEARSCGLSDDHLRGLGNATDLVLLNVAENALLSDAAFCELTKLRRLRFLCLGRTQTTDETLNLISELPSLVSVSLSNTNMTGKTVRSFAAAESLKRFCAEQTPIGDQLLTVLATCPNLEVLWISKSKITDGGVSQLRNHPNLTYVIISGGQLTDASLFSLEGLPKLKRLTVTGWKTTFEAKSEFRKKRPDVDVL